MHSFLPKALRDNLTDYKVKAVEKYLSDGAIRKPKNKAARNRLRAIIKQKFGGNR